MNLKAWNYRWTYCILHQNLLALWATTSLIVEYMWKFCPMGSRNCLLHMGQKRNIGYQTQWAPSYDSLLQNLKDSTDWKKSFDWASIVVHQYIRLRVIDVRIHSVNDRKFHNYNNFYQIHLCKYHCCPDCNNFT